jgi:serine/threonine protein kinase
VKIFGKVLMGVCVLHEKNIAHFDLKLENILINGEDVKISVIYY